MRVIATDLPDVLVVEEPVHRDARGDFVETYRAAGYHEAGIGPFVQHNLSRSRRGVLRGLHYQAPGAQGKLVHVVRGRIFDVAVDVRRESPTFGRHVARELHEPDDVLVQLWIPPGFAHGFCVISDEADVAYQVTTPRRADAEHAVRWDDPALAIPWPVRSPILSSRDAAAPVLADADLG